MMPAEMMWMGANSCSGGGDGDGLCTLLLRSGQVRSAMTRSSLSVEGYCGISHPMVVASEPVIPSITPHPPW